MNANGNTNYYPKYNKCDRSRIQCRTYSEIKLKASGLVYIQYFPYCNAEGLLHLRYCLHDAVIDAAPRIRGKI